MSGGLQPGHLAVCAPVAGAAASLVLLRGPARRPAYAISLLGALVGLLAALMLLVQQLDGSVVTAPGTVGPLPLGELAAPLRLAVTGWSALVCAVVALVSTTVQAFARWYLWDDPRYRTFAAAVGLFTGAMQLVVLSGDLLLTLVGWELMGWCSYLLIAHESDRSAARAAAVRAFLVTRAADVALVLGFAALATGARSTAVDQVVRAWQQQPLAGSVWLTVAMLGVVVGVLGKSAQLPFSDWLPSAMEGPTPASALIHAATMVAAGTVVLARLLPLLQAAPAARTTLLVAAGASALVGAVLAYLQLDLKRLLAWSTVSQVGLMLLALTVLPRGAGPELAVAHLAGHAAFKALLFLVLGWLTVLVGGTVVPRMSGAVRRHPQTGSMVAIGLLALAGVPLTVGFVTKDLILDRAVHGAAGGDPLAVAAAVVVALTAALSAAYAARAWLVLAHRTVLRRREDDTREDDSRVVREVDIAELLRHAPEVDELGRETLPRRELVELEPHPTSGAQLSLGMLAVLALFGGGLVLTPLLPLPWQEVNLLLTAAVLLLMAAAALLVRIWSLSTVHGDATERVPAAWRSAASRGPVLGGAERLLVVRPVLALADAVTAAEGALDRAVDALGRLPRPVAARLDAVHSRSPHHSVLVVAGGAFVVALLGVLLW